MQFGNTTAALNPDLIISANLGGGAAHVGQTAIFPVSAFTGMIFEPSAGLQNVNFTITFYDSSFNTIGTYVVMLDGKDVPNAFGIFNVPVLGPFAQVVALSPSGLAFTASMSLFGHNLGPDKFIGRGGIILAQNVNFTVAATSTGQSVFGGVSQGPNVAEGHASVYIRCTATIFTVSLQALAPDNTWYEISQINNTDPSPARFEVELPPWHCRLQFVNSDAAVRAINYAVAVH